jgi:hypothetical protein
MARTPEFKALAKMVRRLRNAGCEPVLIGGMALIVYGSSRVTFDTDLLTTRPRDLDQAKRLMAAVFGVDFVYVTRFDANGLPVSWIDVPNVAAARLMMDGPGTCFLWNRRTQMRVDLLLDFPIPASEVLEDAKSVKIGERVLLPVASLAKLSVLKEIALRDRSRPEDAQDLAFIRSRISSATR